MEEQNFFEHDGVKVTNARFVVDDQTFAMSNITSVSTSEDPPKRAGPFILGLIAVGLCFSSDGSSGRLVTGLIFAALAVFWWRKQASSYHVVLKTSSGEAKALTSKQAEYVKSVVDAINNAIVHRG